MTSNLNCLTCGQSTLARLVPNAERYELGCKTCNSVFRLNDFVKVIPQGFGHVQVDDSLLTALDDLPCPHCHHTPPLSLWMDTKAICTQCGKSYALLDQVFNIQESKDVTGVQT